jgi:hypothetical protein
MRLLILSILFFGSIGSASNFTSITDGSNFSGREIKMITILGDVMEISGADGVMARVNLADLKTADPMTFGITLLNQQKALVSCRNGFATGNTCKSGLNIILGK